MEKIDRVRFPEGKGTIRAIIDLVDQGRIKLRPPFQRGLVWGDKERKLLLDSIVKDFGFYSILVGGLSG